MNGEFTPWAESTVPLSTHALHYGTGVFEGIRSYAVDGEAAIFRLDAHLRASIDRRKCTACGFHLVQSS